MGNSAILGRLLLIQNSVIELNNEDEIINLICEGLSNLPGINEVKIADKNYRSDDKKLIIYELTDNFKIHCFISDHKVFTPFEKYVNAFCKTLSVILKNKNFGKNENELIDYKEKYFRIFNNIQDVYFEISENGTVLEISPAITVLTKGLINRNEMINKNLLDYYANIDDRDKLRTQVFSKGYVKDFELGLKNKDGSIVYVELSAKIIENESDSLVKIVGNLHDISKRKATEISLRESEEKYRLLVQHSADPIFSFNPDETYRFVNDTFAKPFGKTPSEIIGKTPHSIFAYDEAEKRLTLVRKVFKTGIPEEIEVKVITKTGNETYYLTMVDPIKDESGKILWISCISKNITERKSVEIRLKENEEKFRKVFRAIPEAIALSRLEDGVFYMVNEKFVNYTNFTEDEIIGKTARDLKMYANPEDGLKFYQAVLKNGHIENFFTKYRIKSGEIIDGLVSASVVEIDTKKFILIIMRDITKWKKTEQKLQESEKNYRELIDGMNETVWVINFSGKLIDVNRTAIKQLGYAKEELLEIGLEGIDASISKENIKALAQVMPKDEIQIFESVHKAKDGKQIPVEIYSSLISYYGEQAILSIARDITERKKAETKLKESEERYKIISELTSDFVYKIKVDETQNLKIEYISENLIQIIGDDYQERNIWEIWKNIYHSEDIERLFSFVNSLIKTPQTGEIICRVLFNDGKIDWVQILSKSIWSESEKRVISIIGSIKNISEQKIAQDSLRDERQRLEGIIKGTNAGTWEWNLLTGEMIINARCAEMVGYTLEEVSPVTFETWKNFAHPEDFEKSYILMEKHLKGEQDYYECEVRLRHKNGDWIWILDSGKVVKFTADNKPLIMMGTHQDISYRKRVEEEILRERQQLLSIFNGIDEVVYISDPVTYEILYVNNKLQNLLPRPCLGRICYEEFQGLDSTCEFCTNKIILENKYEPYKWEFYNENLNKYFSITDRIIRWSDGRDVRFELGIDITEQKVAEQNLLIAKEKAEKADKLKSEFLAQMSHEIRSPINTILNSVSLINEDLNECGSEVKEIFPIIDAAGSRIIKTIDAILNMSELQLGIYEPHLKKWNLVEDILKILVREFKHLAEIKNLNFVYDIQTDNTDLFVDQYSATQIFSNLIDNAIKYTKEGCITVAVYKNPENNVSVDVADTGIGISEEFLPYIFSPFSQEEQGYSRKYEGNGLGLALIKKYCSFNNAEISVKSKKNIGTVFTVEFK